MFDQYINMFSPPPLGVTQFTGDIKYVQKIVKENQFESNGGWNSISNDKWILDVPELIDLKNIINNFIRRYVLKVFGIDHSVDITQSWSTVTNNGEEHPVHFHPNSYLSGVMFVKSSDDSSPLLLHNNIKLPSISLDLYDGKESNIPPNEFASVTASTFSVAPTEGSIVLFPSLTPHGVCKSRSKDERIIIAFNTFPRLPFGCERETNLVVSRI
tara:strand:+ start:285 stop:926 length:642 start_codon:yes stop_codon:yes gene_type:complete